VRNGLALIIVLALAVPGSAAAHARLVQSVPANAAVVGDDRPAHGVGAVAQAVA